MGRKIRPKPKRGVFSGALYTQAFKRPKARPIRARGISSISPPTNISVPISRGTATAKRMEATIFAVP